MPPTSVHHLSRSLFAISLSLMLLCASVLSPAAYAQDASGLDAIQAEYHYLIDLFYRPVDPHALLQAGWSALAADATRRGAPAPKALPELPADADGAFATFAAAYSEYVTDLPPSMPVSAAAAAVEMAMANSLQEQHTHFLSPGVMRAFLSTVGGGQSVSRSRRPPGERSARSGDRGGARAVQPRRRASSLATSILAADGKDLSHADTPALQAALAGSAGLDRAVDRRSWARGRAV